MVDGAELAEDAVADDVLFPVGVESGVGVFVGWAAPLLLASSESLNMVNTSTGSTKGPNSSHSAF